MIYRELLIVAKRPAAGQTKTRLTPPLTPVLAAQCYEAFLCDALDAMRQVEVEQRTIAFLPDTARDYFVELAPDFSLAAQRGASLGERLDNLLTDALAQGAQQAVVMSSDCPSLPAQLIQHAFDALSDGADVVLGPAEDGGYYLIGLTRPYPRLLREVQMSTHHVLSDTLRLAAELGLRTALLEPWFDVDTIAELERLRADLASSPADVCRHTRRILAQVGAAGA